MAVSVFERKIDEYSNVYIFTDNQSAIQTIESPKRQSGQYIIKAILDIIDRTYAIKPTCNIHIEWIPGHENVDGNEQADQAAKAAATQLIPYPPQYKNEIRSKKINSNNDENQTGNQVEDRKEYRKTTTKYESTSGHYNRTQIIWKLQQRKHVVWISRLRTGHCHLNEYLHRFKIIETSECECGAGRETVDHFLLNCELYDEERDKLRRKIGAQGMRTSVLLGDSTTIKDTIEYIENTGRFKLE